MAPAGYILMWPDHYFLFVGPTQKEKIMIWPHTRLILYRPAKIFKEEFNLEHCGKNFQRNLFSKKPIVKMSKKSSLK